MRYSTVENWAKYFEESEGVRISPGTIRNRISRAKIIGKTGRNNIKMVLRYAFFSEADVRSACTDLLQSFPQTDENGFIMLNGKNYGTIGGWSKILGISHRFISTRIKTYNPPAIRGKDMRGAINDFFSESVIREICSTLLQDLPRADENGFFIKDGQKYGSIKALSRALSISAPAITDRIKNHNPASIKGRDKTRVIRDFYPEFIIRQICADLLQHVPLTDEEGFFMKDGERYGTIRAWSRVLGISKTTIKARAKTHNLQSIKGKDKKGAVCDFYSESIIRKICSDVLQDISEADKEGFFMKDGERYGTILAWHRVLGISQKAIISRVKTNDPQRIKGKDKLGHVWDFFSGSIIRQICADLLEDAPQVDIEGFFEKDGKKYGTVGVWAKTLGISSNSITPRIKIHGLKGIKGKDRRGAVCDFYSESDIRQICGDLLTKRQK